LLFYNDVCCAIEAVGHKHDTNEVHLLIDSSKVRLKAVLLHNGNKFPSVPLDHVANMKESRENMKLLLEKIRYEKYNLKICGYLKVIALLLGWQLGYTEFCCFVCEWDSRHRKHYYIQKQWSK
jgi:hypothetical protein